MEAFVHVLDTHSLNSDFAVFVRILFQYFCRPCVCARACVGVFNEEFFRGPFVYFADGTRSCPFLRDEEALQIVECSGFSDDHLQGEAVYIASTTCVVAVMCNESHMYISPKS